jgi:sugar lactone lactonase YvrE
MRLIVLMAGSVLLAASARAQVYPITPLLTEEFGKETALNTDLWEVNSETVRHLITVEVGPRVATVEPQLTFSAEGMRFAGVSAAGQSAGIEFGQGLKPPFVVEATVTGIVAHANPFVIYLVSDSSSNVLRIFGNLDPQNAPAYKIGASILGSPVQVLEANPHVGKAYTFRITVGPRGNAGVTLRDENGASIGSAGGFPLGVGGPVHLILGQSEPNPRVKGPNEAVWKRLTVANGTTDLSKASEKAAPGAEAFVVRTALKRSLCVQGLAFDRNGDLYLSDCSLVRKLSHSTGRLTTVAGLDSKSTQYPSDEIRAKGFKPYTGDGGPATKALMSGPGAIAFDRANNLFVADMLNHVIRRVDAATGIITTVAGTGAVFPRERSAGVKATSRDLSAVTSMAVDGAGNIYFVEDGTVLKVNAATGLIDLVKGKNQDRLYPVKSIVVDEKDQLYYTDDACHCIQRLTPATGTITRVAGRVQDVPLPGSPGDGGPATEAGLGGPAVLARDFAGNLYIADALNNDIREVDGKTGVISTVYRRDGQKGDHPNPFVTFAVGSDGEIFVNSLVDNFPAVMQIGRLP